MKRARTSPRGSTAAEPEWTHVSHPSTRQIQQLENSAFIAIDASFIKPQHSPNRNVALDSDGTSSQHQQSNQPLGESDSSTNFDAQAWKRGDSGTGRRRLNPSNPSQSFGSSIINQEYPAFMPSTTSLMSTYNRRRASSTQRSTYSISSSSTSPHTPRPTSDLGPDSQPVQARRSAPPTWRAYTGREGRQNEPQEFLQALANLRAMARTRKVDWLSSSSGADEEDADEPRPRHADLPTSPFNSAADEEEHHEKTLQEHRNEIESDEDEVEKNNTSRFSRWWNTIESAISLKTWQLLGLGGIIFGIGLCAGSLIGRKSQRFTKISALLTRVQLA
ncbi:hypothetical protein O181_037603 [Austropuccinia psidii MF-1]|uniref:Uncharacterized protein n=1 Tax=Austropuccinia psidii MF-1 TaxID=1389203 RepID=A0A9Q3HA94_9BASI|nr:hypothetical protein [Austropuccinia psidii MF-1]